MKGMASDDRVCSGEWLDKRHQSEIDRECRHGVLCNERVGSWGSVRIPAWHVVMTFLKEPAGR